MRIGQQALCVVKKTWLGLDSACLLSCHECSDSCERLGEVSSTFALRNLQNRVIVIEILTKGRPHCQFCKARRKADSFSQSTGYAARRPFGPISRFRRFSAKQELTIS
jgi:hypothetical protein